MRSGRILGSSAAVTASGGYGARPVGTPVRNIYPRPWPRGGSNSVSAGGWATGASPVRRESSGSGSFVNGLRSYSRMEIVGGDPRARGNLG